VKDYGKEFEARLLAGVVARVSEGRLTPAAAEHPLVSAIIEERVQQESRLQASSATDEAQGWVRLSLDGARDLTPLDKDRELELAFHTWRTNPMGHFLIETMVSFVCGDGFTIKADNPEVKKLCEAFWNHPINNLAECFENHIRERGIFGDLALPKFLGRYSGRVAVSYIDPRDIKRVIADPKNAKVKVAVIVRGKNFMDGVKYRIVLHPDIEEYLSPEAQSIRESCGANECYYSLINNLTNENRGTSDLYISTDWCDGYEQFLFDYTDRWPLLNMFVWDLMVKGADETKLNERVKNFTKKSGSVYAHNENETLEAKTPDMKAVDADAGARLLRNHILGAHNIPEVYYGGGGDANRASSEEMGTPFFRSMSRKQKSALALGTFILRDVIREADLRGLLPGVPDEEKNAELMASEMVAKDNSKYATAMQQMSGALVLMKNEGWIDQDNAGKIAAFMLSWIGYEFDYDAVKAELEEAQREKEQEDYKKKPAPDGSASKQI
jgi:hypothetical protein